MNTLPGIACSWAQEMLTTLGAAVRQALDAWSPTWQGLVPVAADSRQMRQRRTALQFALR